LSRNQGKGRCLEAAHKMVGGEKKEKNGSLRRSHAEEGGRSEAKGAGFWARGKRKKEKRKDILKIQRLANKDNSQRGGSRLQRPQEKRGKDSRRTSITTKTQIIREVHVWGKPRNQREIRNITLRTLLKASDKKGKKAD